MAKRGLPGHMSIDVAQWDNLTILRIYNSQHMTSFYCMSHALIHTQAIKHGTIVLSLLVHLMTGLPYYITTLLPHVVRTTILLLTS